MEERSIGLGVEEPGAVDAAGFEAAVEVARG